MSKPWDWIGVDFVGHSGGDYDAEDDLSGSVMDSLDKMIAALTGEAEYYRLFKKCIQNYTRFQIQSASNLYTNIEREKGNIRSGEGHLRGENFGTWGKECSNRLDDIRVEINKLSKLWDQVPEDIQKLVTFTL